MRSFSALLLLVLLACVPARDCQRLTDSLTVRLDSANVRLARARALYVEQLTITTFSQQRALYYAGLVQRRPASAKYLVGWLRRAFDEAAPDSARP